MRFFKSIRWQLQLWHGLLLLGVIGAFGFTAFQLEKTEHIRSIDAGLQQRLSLMVNTLRASPQENGPRPRARGPQDTPPQFDEQRIATLAATPPLEGMFGADSGYYFVVWMRGPKPVAKSPNAPDDIARPDERGPSSRVRAGGYREAFIFAAPVDCVLIGRSMKDANAALLPHALLLAGAGFVLLALGLAGGWWLTNRALRPVREISSTASRIAGGDLSQRINTQETESELGSLAALLNATFSRLDAAFTQQARFTSDAAHELRTPLTVLLTQAQSALTRERSADEYRDALKSVQSTAQRMRKLVESLLQLARLDAGQELLERKKCDLSDLAADCAELMQPLAEARSITLDLHLESAACDADADRISQVITNLIKNAIDYNREHGTVRISTRMQDGMATVEVTDSGCGIPAEHQPHIFERFYRVDASRTGSATRNGLGLAISKAIIDAHGGTISVSSEAGSGTTFRFAVPPMNG